MKIAFFGSPEFAVDTLEAIQESSHELVGVITQPDRPSGRGMKLKAPAVKQTALKFNVPVFQPDSLNCDETIEQLKKWSVEQIVVVAYGEFLGKNILNFCKHAPINVHPSMLPLLRGAAPMQWSLVNGFKKSGVSVQFMVKEMDAGDILIQEEFPIEMGDDALSLHNRAKAIGARLTIKALDQIEDNSFQAKAQDSNLATFAPLLKKSDGYIDWSKSSESIHNQIRGLHLWPCASTKLQSKRIKMIQSRIPSVNECPMEKKEIAKLYFYGEELFVGTADGFLAISKLQPEGKRAMLPSEFANGMRDATANLYFEED